ncbi:MAG: PEP-CTERM sorting domain-containing protein [Cellvibrio sp.]|uniref:PEP-CTERM sorting domain-containing protein n=1 Tax=Cellvibrio sp. TaxID=1965322 RepID=UPI002728A7B5|nr:PEP-CTERM sorting domain-containing protein [Cellvibrio sp.]
MLMFIVFGAYIFFDTLANLLDCSDILQTLLRGSLYTTPLDYFTKKWSFRMFKKIAKCVALITVFSAATAQALPIVQADAFSSGDNKAALETSTGLVWMDFGVNLNQNFTSEMLFTNIVNNLSTTYKGWRLASEAEVTHLWFSLFGSQVIPVSNTNPHEYNLEDWDGLLLPHFQDIADVFGYTWDGLAYINPTGQEGTSVEYINRSAMAHFYTAGGNLGSFKLFTPLSGAGVNLSHTTLNTNDLVPLEFAYGAMLVKDASVPEPSAFILLSLGLLGLGIGRRATR